MLPQFLYADYKWLVDYSAAALVVNVLIEVLAWLWPAVYTQEFNLSLVWNVMAVIFTVYPFYCFDDWQQHQPCQIYLFHTMLSKSRPFGFFRGEGL